MSHLSTLPLLELLRAPPGWRTDRAILSTYSADLAVLVAALLALSGRDDDAGSGSKVALARALSELRGRVVFLLQRGRVAAPRKAPRILALLDRFVHEVPWNEGSSAEGEGRSWHSKLALIRRVAEGDSKVPPQWIFWIGSRNFTRDTSWDIGLALESVPVGSPRGQRVKGIDRLAARLAAQANATETWRPLADELATLEWNVPKGLSVREVSLMLPGDPNRRLPMPPEGVTRTFAVAPFLDGRSIAELSRWGADRTLLSTLPELGRLATQQANPLEDYELLSLPTVPDDGEAPLEEDLSTAETALESRGLHAKIVWAEHGRGATLWLGSPNLTARGWTQNSEAIAVIDVPRRDHGRGKDLHDGIEAFRGMARPVRLEELVDLTENDAVEEALDTARREVAARLSGYQRRLENGDLSLMVTRPPHPDEAQIELAIARLGGGFVVWPRGSTSLLLPGRQDTADSELLVLKVTMGDQCRTWTQIVPFDPPLTEQRDFNVLRDYVGAKGFLLWIRNVLDDLTEEGGLGGWDEVPIDRLGNAASPRSVGAELPTIEQVLRAWLRNPERLKTVDSILRAAHGQPPSPEDDEASLKHLDAFARTWSVVRAKLMEGGSCGP